MKENRGKGKHPNMHNLVSEAMPPVCKSPFANVILYLLVNSATLVNFHSFICKMSFLINISKVSDRSIIRI